YRFHPLFAETAPPLLDGTATAPGLSLEGGDVHVIAPGVVMVGMGERTTAQAVEALAQQLFVTGTAHRLIAVRLPETRAFMHLDTVMTMIDRDTFAVYPGAGFDVSPDADLAVSLAEALGLDKVRFLSAEQDVRAAEREQWDDGSNFLALAPGVVVGYER
ncbi:arginine deiminase family protein, partial [Streptomyces sp. NRRL WC-3742]|uniref:arginine deiminase family protein n=1 Tax=Streptomyces sp. NRRL WC-3742 TaxID=1463934 RepID=UPI0004C5A6AC